MNEEIKKNEAILGDDELEAVSGGATMLGDSGTPVCPNCGGRLYDERDDSYGYLACRACGYRKIIATFG